jgi:ribulose-phosphate 3-epimerase
MKVIEPSLLAFDIHKIPQQLTEIKNCGFAYIHYDVMDGHFVTNTAFQTEWLELINKSGLKANVHFMVQNPDK